MMRPQISDPDVGMLASIAGGLQSDYQEDDNAWEGSPFAWIKSRPSRQVGKIGEQLVAGWCAAKGLDVIGSGDSQCDRVIGGLRTETKFSTLWKNGGYKFQQFRDQNYQLAICLGVSPFDAHCWVITKELLRAHVIGHTPQHGGMSGTDTAWLSLTPTDVPDWLRPCGGRLSQAFPVLLDLSRRNN